MNIPEELKYKIEFFDLPGIKNNESIFKNDETFEKIICLSNLFVFALPMDKNIKDSSTYVIITKLIKNLKCRFLNKKDIIKRFFFILNKCDVNNGNVDLKEYKNNLALFLNENIELIQSEKYSSKFYKNFREIKEYYNNFDININNYKEEYYEKKKYKIFPNIEDYIIKKVKDQFKLDFKNAEISHNNNIILSIDYNKKLDLIKKVCNNKAITSGKNNDIISYFDYGKKNIKNSSAYKKSNAEKFLPFFNDLINKSSKDLNVEFIKLFDSFLKKDLNIFFCRDINNKTYLDKKNNSEEKIKNINIYIETIFKNSNIDQLCKKTNEDITKLFNNYETNVEGELRQYNNNIKNIINALIGEINKKLNDFFNQIKSEFDSLLNQIVVKIKEIDDIIRDNYNFNFKNMNNFKDNFFQKNKYYLGASGGIGLASTTLGAIISELSSSIAFGGVAGGFIGLGIGTIAGGVIIGIRILYKSKTKKKDLLDEINNYRIEYNDIFNGISNSIQENKEEIKKRIINSNKNLIKFINEDINLIPIDIWEKIKEEFNDLTKEFEKLFGEKKKDDEENNMLHFSHYSSK